MFSVFDCGFQNWSHPHQSSHKKSQGLPMSEINLGSISQVNSSIV